MRKFLAVFFILTVAQIIFGQDDIQTPTGRPLPKTLEQVRNENLGKRMGDLRRLGNSRQEISLPKTKRLSKEERERVEKIAEVDKNLKLKYKNFLKQSNTGIFRLLPDFECETKNVIRLDGDCKNFVPGLWTYSFRSKNYSNKILYDLTFKGDNLVTGSLLSQGILVSLGDKSLDSVLLESPGLSFLTSFAPATERETISEQYREISKGIEQHGLLLTNKLKMEENTTYALRTIAYDYKDEWTSRMWDKNADKVSEDEREFIAIDYDTRNDSIYIFRVVKKSDDGGVTILWKRLSKEKSPKLVYQEDEKLADFKSKN